MPFTAPRWERAMGSSSYRGIQTIRNWPGCPPRSARKRYVIVVGVSRTISRRGTTWILGMGDPDRLRYGVEARFLQENAHFLYDFVEDAEAPREDRGSDLDRARTGHDVLQGVATRSDPTDADHGDMDLLADVVHGSHSDRPDRGAAKAAVLVRQRRHLQFWRDRHCLQCVDRDNPVGPAFLGGHGESGDVLDVRRELGKDGNVDDILHRAGEVPDRAGARLVDAGHGPYGFVEKPRGEHRWVSKPHPGDLGPEVHHREDRIDRGPKGFGWRNHPELTQRKRLGSRSCLAQVRRLRGGAKGALAMSRLNQACSGDMLMWGPRVTQYHGGGELEAVGPLWDRF